MNAALQVLMRNLVDYRMSGPLKNSISPLDEMVAYEALWGRQNQTLKSIATLFKERRILPSELLKEQKETELFDELFETVRKYLSNKRGFSVAVHGDFLYPLKLQHARYPIELFYFKGDIGFVDSPCISVVGSRKASSIGKRRAKKIVSELVRRNFTIVSGLAVGIDTAALTAAIQSGGRVIAVIGTPIDEYYPKENRELQDEIARRHLLISQVPFFRYSREPFASKKVYFPQRNETMSALSEATIIIEASDTSGTLTQARACLEQGRKLFILNSCFERDDITWPAYYEKRGAIRVKTISDILKALN